MSATETNVNGWVGNPADLSSFNAFGVVTLSDGQTVNVQLTGRHGLADDKLYEDFKRFVAFLDRCAVDSAVKFWNKKEAENTVVSSGSPSGEKPARRYDQPLTQAELPAELAEITVDVFQQDFDYFVVEPKPDEKASVKFYKDDLTWPVGAHINNWKHQTIKEALVSAAENLDPSKADKYRVAGVQYWKKGAEYTITKGEKKGQTSNYKDLILVKATF
jgi:hypothetical protein